eukprot:GILJ01020724.1.p1 GENE.GILJ01020724.1~~GILJ01020724.1.p1  ORF type:complete len:236 (+),score=9.76 GILJ01020724.1:167-874(+)
MTEVMPNEQPDVSNSRLPNGLLVRKVRPHPVENVGPFIASNYQALNRIFTFTPLLMILSFSDTHKPFDEQTFFKHTTKRGTYGLHRAYADAIDPQAFISLVQVFITLGLKARSDDDDPDTTQIEVQGHRLQSGRPIKDFVNSLFTQIRGKHYPVNCWKHLWYEIRRDQWYPIYALLDEDVLLGRVDLTNEEDLPLLPRPNDAPLDRVWLNAWVTRKRSNPNDTRLPCPPYSQRAV